MFKTLKINLVPMLATSFVAGLILSVLAPYGTHKISVFFRLAYWVLLCMAGGLGAGFVKSWMMSPKKPRPKWVMALAQSLGATLVVSTLLIGFTVIVDTVSNPFYLAVLPVFVWIISIIICGFGVLLDAQHPREDFPKRAALFERLKPALRQSDILALSAEDHYVRVITANGEDLILMRLSDAISETSPLIGLSPHRSWWVAETGVKSIDKSNGKTEIKLWNDRIIPVSRSGLKRIREAGWG